MIPLTKLKKDMQFNTELTKVVDVLRGIATSRYYVLERQLSLFEEFSKACEGILTLVDLSSLEHPFLKPASGTTAVLMVTSDAGFLGGLNTQVVNVGLREAGPQGLLTIVGERGAGTLRDLHRTFTPFPGIQDADREALAKAIRDHLVRQFLSHSCGRLVVVYPKPVSFAVQQVMGEIFLPVTEWIGPRRGRVRMEQVLWESRPEDLLEYMTIQWMAHRLSMLFALSRLAELAARAIHLEGSFQELQRLEKRLRLQYFKARHEVIDRSMREIFATQLLYRAEAGLPPADEEEG